MNRVSAGGRASETGWPALFTARRLLLISLLLGGVLLHSMNVLITATLLPSIVTDIGGAGLISWTTTAFVASSIVAAAATGVFVAAIGTRKSFCAGAATYCLGSVLCALASTMLQVIAGRFVQGFGGGLLSALAYVLVREVFPKTLWPHAIGLLGGIWSVSVLLGPLAGGVFAAYGQWRGAFVAVAAVAGLLTVLTPLILPGSSNDEDARTPHAPVLRIIWICVGIAMLSSASLARGTLTKVVLIAGAFGAFIHMLRLDRSSREAILPTDAFSLRSATGLGMWMILLVSAAYNPLLTYGPLFLQKLHNLNPLAAGYMVAVASLTWTIVAIGVPSLTGAWPGLMIVAGPLVMGVGLLGFGSMMAYASVPMLILPIALIGGGIGACFAFIAQRVMGGAKKGEENVAASSNATIELVGISFGAAFSGLIANASGLSDGLSHDSIIRAAFWVPVGFIGVTVIAGVLGHRLNRLMSQAPQTNPVK